MNMNGVETVFSSSVSMAIIMLHQNKPSFSLMYLCLEKVSEKLRASISVSLDLRNSCPSSFDIKLMAVIQSGEMVKLPTPNKKKLVPSIN